VTSSIETDEAERLLTGNHEDFSAVADGVVESVVSVHNLAKRYSGWTLFGRRPVDALNGVSLTARAGEVFGLLGPNGAGKTTLIKILLGVVKPTGGTAELFGEPVGSMAARQRVGYLPESLRVDRHHTARSALRYYGRLSRMSAREIELRSDELLELVGLRGRDRESVRRFSKGMYQRLGLAQALMHDPDLLVLDEPTDGLDPVGRNEVRRVIERLRDAGKTIFLNSHILQEVEMVCTRVAIMARGRICGSGTVDELVGDVRAEQVTFDLLLPDVTDPSATLLPVFASHEASDLNIIPIDFARGSHRVTARLPEQKQVDEVVDGLRSLSISIVKLHVKRPTLEDMFIKLVSTPDKAD
jgi:ABC-2 type transport system ATP-binding protein